MSNSKNERRDCRDCQNYAETDGVFNNPVCLHWDSPLTSLNDRRDERRFIPCGDFNLAEDETKYIKTGSGTDA
ncbi:MAG: hypothetical protein FWE67_07265 [Planctomycetaceae bacterium]|nr:hypothetical protein [Planctomycetaceae bacterium]